eukprot:gnl/Chilomastix_cuspidata/546.p1 GENE.gnl/Chilomastix_cuspidata/546~~gnl/Chilomastix_cuspidata/546.p1  ORF type:complete len:588 (+),score=135.80 gnl/Chilomastix_cuspidata/546:894-2657(+)
MSEYQEILSMLEEQGALVGNDCVKLFDFFQVFQIPEEESDFILSDLGAELEESMPVEEILEVLKKLRFDPKISSDDYSDSGSEQRPFTPSNAPPGRVRARRATLPAPRETAEFEESTSSKKDIGFAEADEYAAPARGRYDRASARLSMTFADNEQFQELVKQQSVLIDQIEAMRHEVDTVNEECEKLQIERNRLMAAAAEGEELKIQIKELQTACGMKDKEIKQLKADNASLVDVRTKLEHRNQVQGLELQRYESEQGTAASLQQALGQMNTVISSLSAELTQARLVTAGASKTAKRARGVASRVTSATDSIKEKALLLVEASEQLKFRSETALQRSQLSPIATPFADMPDAPAAASQILTSTYSLEPAHGNASIVIEKLEDIEAAIETVSRVSIFSGAQVTPPTARTLCEFGMTMYYGQLRRVEGFGRHNGNWGFFMLLKTGEMRCFSNPEKVKPQTTLYLWQSKGVLFEQSTEDPIIHIDVGDSSVRTYKVMGARPEITKLWYGAILHMVRIQQQIRREERAQKVNILSPFAKSLSPQPRPPAFSSPQSMSVAYEETSSNSGDPLHQTAVIPSEASHSNISSDPQ